MSSRIIAPTLISGFLALPFLAVPAAAAPASKGASTAGASPAATTRRVASLDALDWGLKFASAIRSDAKDRSWAEEIVVLDYALVGALDEAAAKAAVIEGWRRGVAYAEIAALLAKVGRAEEARDLVAKAEAVRAETGGWQNPRIASHIANALAALDDLDRVRSNNEVAMADDQRFYAGRVAATEAVALARKGRFDAAFAALQAIDADNDIEVASARVRGYVELSRVPGIEPALRDRALVAARGSCAAVPPFLRPELFDLVADAYRDAKRTRDAKAILTEAGDVARTLPETQPIKGMALASVARSWAELGETSRAKDLLREAMLSVPQTGVIERPAVYANVATAFRAAKDDVEARRVLNLALEGAESLENSRPRALAAVEVCRAMGRFDMPLTDGDLARFETILSGLKDPW